MNDEQLAQHLRDELARIAKEPGLVTVTVPVWMFRRMAEIVVGNTPLMNIDIEKVEVTDG